jgi:hypothetical protein
MGAFTSYPEEPVYRICLKCIKNELRNENIELLNISKLTTDYKPADWQRTEFTLMCSKGHIFTYMSNRNEHTQALVKYFEKLHTDTNLKETNEKLKEEIESLKQEIDVLKQFTPSAPNIPIAEAVFSTSKL